MNYKTYRVSKTGRAPITSFIWKALEASGCTVLRMSEFGTAPFQVTFETPSGYRMGIVAYAFLANQRVTKNRPVDEHRFQIKYGSKDGRLHNLWQDPYGLYTTLLLGINPEQEFFVGLDPVLNSPTRFFISKEFKQLHVDTLLGTGWYAWERDQRSGAESPIEVLVGGTPDNFLRYVLFEREVVGEEQGHRQLVAETFRSTDLGRKTSDPSSDLPIVSLERLHALEKEFALPRSEILDLISQAPRLKMAVRGWVAEHHLFETLRQLKSVKNCQQLNEDGSPDFRVRMARGRPVLVECKNVLRKPDRLGNPRIDFMRTRAAIGNPCSRYYSASDFDVIAACLHAQSETWTFMSKNTVELDPHPSCRGKLTNRVAVDASWSSDIESVLMRAALS
jgi:hypothetical protein